MAKKKRYFCVMYRGESSIFDDENDSVKFMNESENFDGEFREFNNLEIAILWGEVQELKAMNSHATLSDAERNFVKISETFKEIAQLYRCIPQPSIGAKKMAACYDKLKGLFLE